MRPGRGLPLGTPHAPPRGGTESGGTGAAGVDRRGIHAASVLREPQDDGLPAGPGLPDQPQAASAADANPGTCAQAIPSPAKLESANRRLQQEIEVRRHSELRVRQLNDELERMVEQRTAELVETNRQLEAEIRERRRFEAS